MGFWFASFVWVDTAPTQFQVVEPERFIGVLTEVGKEFPQVATADE